LVRAGLQQTFRNPLDRPPEGGYLPGAVSPYQRSGRNAQSSSLPYL
jgi:hypothetical protein